MPGWLGRRSRSYTRFDDPLNSVSPRVVEGPRAPAQPTLKSVSSTNEPPRLSVLENIVRTTRQCCVKSRHNGPIRENNANWKPIRNEDRFFHSQVEVLPQITEDDVYQYIAERKREKEQKKADREKKEKEHMDHMIETESSSAGSSGSGTQPLTATKHGRDKEEKKSDKPDRKMTDQNIINEEDHQIIDKERLLNDDAIKTSQSGKYTYFKPKGKKAGRRIAFFDGKLKRVSNIETLEETFVVRFHYYLMWLLSRDEVLAMKAAEEDEKLDEKWEPDQFPELECANLVDGDLERNERFKLKDGHKFPCLKNQNPETDFASGWGKSSWDIDSMDLGFDPRNAYWCRVKYEGTLVCAEEMELEMFPFDCQDLGVYLKLTQKANQWDILPLPRFGEIFNVDARFSMVSEWKIPGVLLEFKQGDPKVAKNGVGYNSVIIRVKAERKWEVRLADSVTIFCMFWLGLATFGMSVEDVGDRLAYCITLLLTDVATMQLLNENIPNIPYRTFLDAYTYACFLFLVAITIWCTVAGFDGRALFGHKVDYLAFVFFSVAAVLMHVLFYIRIRDGHSLERSKLKMDSEGLDEYFDKMSHLGSVSSMPQAGIYWDSRSIRKQDPDSDTKVTNIGELRWTALSYPWDNDSTI